MTVEITLQDENQAFALSQFFKRMTFDDAYKCADGHLSEDAQTEYAYAVLSGVEAIQKGLRDIGIAVR